MAATVMACGGGQTSARTPAGMKALAPSLTAAFREEAVGTHERAVDRYLQALDRAASGPEDPSSIAVVLASLDALVHRDVSAFSDVASSSALVDRTVGAWASAASGLDAKLARVQEHADGPFSKALVANARLALAERHGDAAHASRLRAQVGCARHVALLGPTAWMPVSGVHEASPLDAFDAPLARSYPGPGPFLPAIVPSAVRALGCRIPLTAETNVPGVRDVVVDVDVPEAGDYGVGLRAAGEATLRAGGKLAILKPASVGSGEALRLARVHVDRAGVLRLVARVGMADDFATVELDAWDASGAPLRTHAPAVDARATVAASRVEAIALPESQDDEGRLALALAALAAGENHTAENLLHDRVARPDAPADLLLAYARAVRLASDLPRVDANERARGAFDRVLEAWPSSWEAMIEHAVLAGVRRGPTEARIEALADLDASRKKASPAQAAIVDAFDAAIAGSARVTDRARAAFARIEKSLAGTPLLHDVDRIVRDRTGAELAAFDCDPTVAADRSTLACQRSLLAAGDRAASERELERLRALADSPTLYLSLSVRSALEAGDVARAKAIDAAMTPGNRLLSTLYALSGKPAPESLFERARTARDAPRALPGLLRAIGDDPLARWNGVAERVTREGEASSLAEGAATIVLAHEEVYDVDARGFVHGLVLDVRRVMGTTDVEANAEASAPALFGKETTRILRRRIFKKDGRVLLPEATPNAAQSHADLSQLETGDAVEAIYEGWALPDTAGNLGFDTPDLLPERTTVQHARIEVALPTTIHGSLVAHPLLGRPEEKTERGKRVLTWTVDQRPVRRIESGVPKMDREVGVRFATTTWNDVARALRETIADLDESSPEVRRWARENAAGKTSQRAVVEAIVEASGRAVKEASGIVLMDVALGGFGSRATTARTILATHEGSRTWLVVRALRELGIRADVVVAENDPFSDNPDFPPHAGRFTHPLAVAHVVEAEAGEATEAHGDRAPSGAPTDVWIDADVPGPPLPAGRVSPELRGRFALWTDGRIAKLPANAATSERDEVDQRLVVDAEGNAKGVLTVLLRGRSAQDLAEALVRLVGAERQQALRAIALAWMPFATVENVELSSTEGSWQVAIRAELSAPAYAQLQGTTPGTQTWILPGIDPLHYVYPRPYVTTLTAIYAGRSTRESALAIGRASQYHVRRRVELPAGAQVARLPGPFDARGPLLSAERRLQVNGPTIEEDFVLDVATGTVPRAQYDGFVAEARRIDDAFRASTQVKPPSATSP